MELTPLSGKQIDAEMDFSCTGLFRALYLLLYCFLMECLQNFKALGPTQPGFIPMLESDKTWLWGSIWSYIVFFIF